MVAPKPGCESLPIDLRFKGLGLPKNRFHIRSGTKKAPVRDAMKSMFRTLYQMGQGTVIRDVYAGKVTALQVYDSYRRAPHKVNELPTGELMASFASAFREWLDGKQISAATQHDYRQALKRLSASAGEIAMQELPQALETHRRESMTDRPRSFNKDRSAALSFLGTKLGETHHLYTACARVEVLRIPEANKMPQNPQTLAEIEHLARKLPEHHVRTLWDYVLTGMRPEELFKEDENSWVIEEGLVRIIGTKNAAARRVVPLVGVMHKPTTKRRAFAKALDVASDGTVTPYDLRRTYAQLLDLLHLPTFRQDFYMGHGPKNPREQYRKMKEALPYIAADAAALDALTASHRKEIEA